MNKFLFKYKLPMMVVAVVCSVTFVWGCNWPEAEPNKSPGNGVGNLVFSTNCACLNESSKNINAYFYNEPLNSKRAIDKVITINTGICDSISACKSDELELTGQYKMKVTRSTSNTYAIYKFVYQGVRK